MSSDLATVEGSGPPPRTAPRHAASALVQRLRWRVLRPLDGQLQGDHRTAFRGNGVDLADLRPYLPGDDTRHIDWNVTARMSEPYVRRYTEDREVTGWLLLDRTASMAFGPTDRLKSLVLAEVAAVLAELLVRGGNRVGAALFDHNEVRRIIPVGTGRGQVLRIVHELLPDRQRPTPGTASGTAPARGRTAEPTPGAAPGADRSPGPTRRRRWWHRRTAAPPVEGSTDLGVLLRAGAGLARRRSVVVIVSDFISAPGWERSLALLTRRHDVVAIRITDPRDSDLPAVGAMWVEDAETGEQLLVDTTDPVFRRTLADAAAARDAALTATVRRSGTELFSIGTQDDLVPALARISELRRAGSPAAGGSR